MKIAITVRVDAALLLEAKRCAQLENRTLTNFIETLMQRRIAELASQAGARHTQRSNTIKKWQKYLKR